MNHISGVGLITQPADQQSSATNVPRMPPEEEEEEDQEGMG